jgi:uncharacterized LabA/DUF88 family protein
MQQPTRNIAYIDAANLHRGITSQEWQLDYKRFISWLRSKYGVTTVYIFIGYLLRQEAFYQLLRQVGYTIIFKEVIYNDAGRIKGNCDVDLAIQATRDTVELTVSQGILISSDGDFAPLVKLWQEKKVAPVIVSPYRFNDCSWFLRKLNVPLILLNDI